MHASTGIGSRFAKSERRRLKLKISPSYRPLAGFKGQGRGPKEVEGKRMSKRGQKGGKGEGREGREGKA